MEQPIPLVSHEDVERIIERDFGAAQAQTVRSELQRFEGWPRVQLAVLKLANGDFKELRKAEIAAAEDPRDVLAWAEYPRYTNEVGLSHGPDASRRSIIESDRNEYQEWLMRN